MKLLLKLFLILFVLIAGIYAATPLWLPYILAGQLPPGWQLEELQSGYPGPRSINVDLLRVINESGIAAITITASDVHFTYRGPSTDIGLVSLDVYPRVFLAGSDDPLTLDDLSLPVTNLIVPSLRLSVDKMRVALHLVDAIQTGTHVPARPLVFEFEAAELAPRADQGFHLSSEVVIADSLRLAARLEINAEPDMINAFIRFPSAEDQAPWLTLEMLQETQAAQTSTRIRAVLDTEAANRDWLDSILADSTGQLFTQLGGKLEMQARFSGQDRQHIENLSLTSDNLLLVTQGGTLNLSADLLASREGENIAVNLHSPVIFRYQGKTGWLDQLPGKTVQGLQLTPRSEATIKSTLGSGSRVLILGGSRPAFSFNGDIDFDLNASAEHLVLRSTAMQIAMADLYTPDSISAEGLIKLDWDIKKPVTYITKDQQSKAASLSIAAEIESRNGQLFTTGSGTLTQASLTSPIASAGKIDITWQGLDLASLTGNLGVRTHGFAAELDNEKWTGFDFDITRALLRETGVSGTGTLVIAGRPEMAFEFFGETESGRWNIKLPPTTIKLTRLRNLLSVAHVSLPAPIKLTDGDIELQGDIVVDDVITAKMLIGGHEMLASMHDSSVRNTSFTFNAGYDNTPWANGPVSIEVFALAGGIDVSNISSEFELENADSFGLKNLYAEVFDGQLKLEKLQFLQNNIADTTVQFSHISLAKLLAYADIDGLDGTGFLDITVPIGSDQYRYAC